LALPFVFSSTEIEECKAIVSFHVPADRTLDIDAANGCAKSPAASATVESGGGCLTPEKNFREGLYAGRLTPLRFAGDFCSRAGDFFICFSGETPSGRLRREPVFLVTTCSARFRASLSFLVMTTRGIGFTDHDEGKVDMRGKYERGKLGVEFKKLGGLIDSPF
jgi:hypothetical protein